MSAAADTLGERLKAGREQKGFSTQKVADELHLDPWVIDALESGDYARIGPAVYGKGHLKRYAALLGLPADEVLLLYDTRTPVPASAPPAAALRMPAAETAAGGRSVATWVAALGLVLLIALFALWRPWQPRSPVDAHIPAAAPAAALDESTAAGTADPAASGAGMFGAQAPPVRSAAPAAVTAAAAAPTGVAPTAPPPTTSAQVAAAPGGGAAVEPHAALGRARLKLSFSADSWVDVHDATGRRLFAGHGRANSVKTLAGAAPLSVYLGFASGVQLEVNNHAVAIGPQFLAGDVARFEAGADGVLRRDAHTSAAAANPHPRG